MPCIKYVSNVEVTHPIGTGRPAESKIMAHCTTAGGKWSMRGVMGALTKVFGDDPMDAYNNHPMPLGATQFVSVSNRYNAGKLWVCNLHVLKAGPSPSLIWEAFVQAVDKLSEFALKHHASIHFVRLHPSTPDLDWAMVHKQLDLKLAQQGVDVVVYTKEKQDLPKAPADAPAAKKPKNCDQVFANMRFAIAGYSSEETVALMQLIESMGGSVQPKYISFGSNQTDVLLCDSEHSDMFKHVDQLGGTIVSKAYVEESFSKNTRLPYSCYLQNPPDPSTTPSPMSVTHAAPTSPLADLFTGLRFHLCCGAARAQVARYIIAYNGKIAESVAVADYVIVADPETSPISAPSHAKLVNVGWLWQSINLLEIAAPSSFPVCPKQALK
eukprot:NODE_2221_length_1245_cov_48.421288_g2110_i0.p1 GENE.NODE_2221_length_1245_cov_48.421288_g2110_i0~~NODE_2221_length_1245_cov_48.421288_g2110_i0.p1  ORF type:complete len:383 (+),score=63.06 NODE_2221_length_1245_cov_48.421288_g2110_i0:1-1149(+)